MPEPWLTFAPIESILLPNTITVPYSFNEHVSIQAIPEWVREVGEEEDPLRGYLKTKLHSGEGHCIAVEYESDTLGVDQQKATDNIYSTHLTLWLSRPTPLSFGVVVHAVQHGSEWVLRQVAPYSPAIALGQYAGDQLEEEDFGKAKTLFGVLQSVSANGPVRIAAQATKKALVEGNWEIRFLLMWIALECLFGPEDVREMSFRLSQRLALFLEADRAQAQGRESHLPPIEAFLRYYEKSPS